MTSGLPPAPGSEEPPPGAPEPSAPAAEQAPLLAQSFLRRPAPENP